ncbi:MAG: hormogonium polysaccharide biosynthesis glycosyltransferase HpsE [Cyanobacteria bacterium]|nr:hormogonium polysaccharide biosynthesis glycosyltransferase HpsE [Cyanobacteriota bacterium]
MVDFTVTICTYNGASQLPQVLDLLLVQQHTDNLSWDVLIVDNHSTDSTAALIRHYQSQWRQDAPLRYCLEPCQGLAYARRRAIASTTAPWIGFLDDDNPPAPDWVRQAYDFGQAHPQAGAYGSEIQALYEPGVTPPSGFERIAPLLAIIQRGPEPFIYTHQRGVLPAGAGMVIRRGAWLAHVPEQPCMVGVKGRSLVAKGEDVETLGYIRDGGWQVWHNPAMKIGHTLPARRLQRSYLVNLCRSVGLNRFPLRMVRYRPWQRPFMVLAYCLSDLLRLGRYLRQPRGSRAEEVVRACELTLLVSSLLSPFYALQAALTLGHKSLLDRLARFTFRQTLNFEP